MRDPLITSLSQLAAELLLELPALQQEAANRLDNASPRRAEGWGVKRLRVVVAMGRERSERELLPQI